MPSLSLVAKTNQPLSQGRELGGSMDKKLLSILLQAQAIRIRVDGMKAENQRYEYKHKPPPFTQYDFDNQAEKVDALIEQLNNDTI